MTFAIAMRTADRRAVGRRNYLGETLTNLARAGVFESPLLREFHLVHTGGSPEFVRQTLEVLFAEVHRFRVHEPTNVVLTPNQAATLAHETVVDTDADYVIFMEDDIDVCAAFLESVELWLEQYAQTENIPLFSLGANYDQIEAAMYNGYAAWFYPVNAYYGTQCYVVSREQNERLVPWLEAHPLHYGKTKCHDLRLQDWMREQGATHLLASAPSFVQHIGLESGMGNKHFAFKTWQGREWSYKPLVTK